MSLPLSDDRCFLICPDSLSLSLGLFLRSSFFCPQVLLINGTAITAHDDDDDDGDDDSDDDKEENHVFPLTAAVNDDDDDNDAGNNEIS